MKSYDDLQRFKEKTQINHIEFKDMSEQTKDSDSASWSIIKQLMDEGAESTLGNGQSVHVATPQSVAEDFFSLPVAPSASQVSPAQMQVQQRPAQPINVAAKPAAQVGGSLLDSISASLKPVPVTEQPQPAFVQLSPPSPAAQPAFVAAQPASQTSSADLSHFKQLFSTAPERQVTTLSEDTLLQPLLEKIASCR